MPPGRSCEPACSFDSSVEGAQRTPRWSPDGQQITYLVGQSLFTVPALGGTPRPLIDASGYEYASPALSPDGRTIAFGRQDGIYLRPALGGDATRLTAARWPSYPVWSPDGRRIAFVSDNTWYVYSSAMLGNIAPSSIWVADVSTHETVRISDADHLNAAPAWLPDGRGLLYVSGQGGGRDIYAISLDRSGRPRGRPARLTTGANAHTISISGDGTRLAYSELTTRSNVWWAPIGSAVGSTSSSAKPITEGSQNGETERSYKVTFIMKTSADNGEPYTTEVKVIRGWHVSRGDHGPTDRVAEVPVGHDERREAEGVL